MSNEKKETRSDKAVRELLDMIRVRHIYMPGDKLPNENELAEQLGVSRTTVRNAIQNLVSQGVLEVRRGKGTFVAPDTGAADDFGFNSLQFMNMKIRDLYELRFMLEPQMAYYAAQRATEDELAEILALGKALEDSAAQKGEDTQGNLLFHLAIARASHNEFAIRLAEIIHTAQIRSFRDSAVRQTLSADVITDHRLIMSYLELRDPEGARQATMLHLRHAIKDYIH